MVNDDLILAKQPYCSGGMEWQVTLDEHSNTVLQAAAIMFGGRKASTRLALQWLRFFRLPEDLIQPFLFNLWLAALFHDLGKANDGFQRMLRHDGEQNIRHEHLSALMLWLPPFREWLATLAPQGVDREIVVGAVASHHLKADDVKFGWRLHDGARAVKVYAASAAVTAVLKLAAEQFGVPPPDISQYAGVWRFEHEIKARRDELGEAFDNFDSQLRRDDRRRRLLLAVKAALLAVDSAGSAATRTSRDLEQWLQSAFAVPPLTSADIESRVIEPRIADLARQGRWQRFQDFQVQAASLGPRALLLAGCGSGKTLAAWKWAAAQLARCEASRVLFLYPTRATATEGFRDYVSWAGPEEAALVSGTARYDLLGLFENPGRGGDPRSGGDYAVPERLFALAYWERRVFSATVDSFLACMSNRYAALCLLPLLADSVVIVDEVHSFSPTMFKALERLLDEFDVPVLCMTASLPEDRIRVLRDIRKLEVYPRDQAAFPNLAAQADADRYRVHLTNEQLAMEIAIQKLRNDKRVLWVVNTVARCQRIARTLLSVQGIAESVLCYHSRFKLEDRKRRHEEVINAFRPEVKPFILVTTQVCEMSLDLDADVLITELAPVPALIQRMGRCCREQFPSLNRRGEVYTYPPPGFPLEGFLPYERKELEQGAAFIASLADRPRISQADLNDRLRALPVEEPYVHGRFAAFPDSGPYATSWEDPFREDDGFVVDAILDRDIEAWLEARRHKEPAEGLVVPVPRRWAKSDERLGAFLFRAPGERYNDVLGFQDEVSTGA